MVTHFHIIHPNMKTHRILFTSYFHFDFSQCITINKTGPFGNSVFCDQSWLMLCCLFVSLSHYSAVRDVQTMAMICCMFWDKEPPMMRDLIASMSRPESRLSFEYAAANVSFCFCLVVLLLVNKYGATVDQNQWFLWIANLDLDFILHFVFFFADLKLFQQRYFQ